MINLIPPHARKEVVKEYWFRVVAVWLFLIAFAFVVVAVLKMPSYVLVVSQANTFADEAKQAELNIEEAEAFEEEIKTANNQAQHLLDESTSTSFSVLLEELTSLSGAGVTIDQFAVSRTAGGLGEIRISGTANSRSALTSFDDAIENHALFDEAVLPIANLAQESNINYQITITPAKPVSP